ncbi:MAG TPA: hypothetical protein VIH04_09405 [Nitrosarchaeum sp.]
MLKKLFFSFVLSAIFLSIAISNPANAELTATLWAPEEVLLKEKYYALIIIDSNTNSESTFDIVTDNEEVIKIKTETVVIPAGKHHGLIEFETIGTGDAEIYAIFQDTLLKEDIRVVESAESPTTLDLILPSDLVNVLVDDNKHTGYVFLLNDFENPVTAKEPISVTLTSNGEVTLPSKSVIIESGNHYAKFIFESQGEGTISASAPNLLPDEEDISLDNTDEIELKMAIAPEPIPTDSSGEIYFWLEREGDPYIVPHDVKVTISIDKSSNLSFDSAIEGAIVLTPNTSDRRSTESGAKEIITRTEVQLAQDSEREFILKAGTHYGKMQAYSSFDEASDITISGLAESVDPKADEEFIKVSNTFDVSTEKSTFGIGTETKVFAFPDPAYKQVEIIVSSYSDGGPVIERDDESFTVFTDNKLILESDSQKIIKTDKNYAVIIANVVDSGSVDIFAERNEAESNEISITTSGKYVKNPELNVVVLPAIFNTEQDLFLVSSSQEKIITNVSDKDDGNLISITTRPDFKFETFQESESVITVRGTISELLEDDPEIHISSNAFIVDDVLKVYNPERKKINSLHPNYVYPKELFPIITHINDLDENPIRKEALKISSIENMGSISDLFYFNQTGSHDVIFYDKNSVPIKSAITVKGETRQTSESPAIEVVRVITYDIQVTDGEGTGTYEEEEEVTISAPPTKDDIFIIKKKFAGWENLPYKESSVTFEADDDINTRPIYEDDYSFLFIISGTVAAMVAFMVIKKKKPKDIKKPSKEDDDLLELLGE